MFPKAEATAVAVVTRSRSVLELESMNPMRNVPVIRGHVEQKERLDRLDDIFENCFFTETGNKDSAWIDEAAQVGMGRIGQRADTERFTPPAVDRSYLQGT